MYTNSEQFVLKKKKTHLSAQEWDFLKSRFSWVAIRPYYKNICEKLGGGKRQKNYFKIWEKNHLGLGLFKTFMIGLWKMGMISYFKEILYSGRLSYNCKLESYKTNLETWGVY